MSEKTTPVYDHNQIQVLSELQHIRQNASMYIGETTNPNHLLYEVLDNSLDEANAKHASLVGVFIDSKNHIITISDNGRGIPITGNVVPTIATKLFSGGKFKKGEGDSAYGIAAGLHGIGLVAVTALADWLEIIIYRDNKKATYRFEDGVLKSEKQIDSPSDKRPFATQVSFHPSKKYFQSLDIIANPVRERMKLASVHIEHLKLILMVDDNKEIINCGIEDYFKETLLTGDAKNCTQILNIKNKIKDEEVDIRFAWDMTSSSSAAKHTGCVNLLSVDQGTHINMTYTIFRDLFSEYAKKEKLTFLPQDCLVGFRCHIGISLYTPEYTSQTKEKLSVRKEKLDPLYVTLSKQLDLIFEKNNDLKMQLLAFFESYRKSLSANKSIIKGGKNVNRFCQIIDTKLKDCSSHNVEHSELFITEGSSAAGGLIQCRDPRYHAVLGLKGKIPNLAAGKKDFLKNKEIIEIMNALGTGIDPDFSRDGMRYGKVLISTDADVDGCAGKASYIYIQYKTEQIQKVQFKDVIENLDKFRECLTVGFDEDTNKYIWTPIIKIWPFKTFHRWLDIVMDDGSILPLTHDHLVKVKDRGWIRADEIQETDDIEDANETIEDSKYFRIL